MKKHTKNILLVHSSNDLYGASKILISIVELLLKSKYSVFLILPENGPLNNHPIIMKTSFITINMGIFRKKYLNFFGLLNRSFFIIKSTFEIKKYIKKNDIDLLYNNTSTIISSTFAAYLSKIPIIYHIHEIPIGSKYYTKFLTKIFNFFSSKIIAVSNVTRDFWINKGVYKSKINVIHNGFDFNFLDKNKLHNNKLIFTNISRIIPYKGHLFLINLFNEILKINKNLTLQIVGDTLPYYNPYLDKLKSKVKEFDIEKNVLFLGYKKDTESILSNSHFFIHTPIAPDPFPTVLFEAIQSKTPIIFTANGGSKEILDQSKNGLLIDDTDIKQSAQLILNYINNLSLQNNNVEDAIKFVSKNYNKEIFSKKITSLISTF